MEVNGSSASLDTASLEQKLKDLVEGYPVKLEVVNALPQTVSCKHRYVISDFVDKSLLTGTDVMKTAKPMFPGSASRPKDVK